MKQFKCGDVVPGCQWVTRSEDETELFEEIHVPRARGARDGRGSAGGRRRDPGRDHRGLDSAPAARERAALEERLERVGVRREFEALLGTQASL